MTGKQEGTGIPAIITIFILCMCLTLSAVDMAGAAKGYIDFKSVRIQSTAAKYNGQPNRWGIGNHGRYLAQDFNIDTGGLVSKDRIKKNTYAFCMQPNMTGPWRYGGGGKTFSVDHQYGPYNELGDSWDELGSTEKETEVWQNKFRSKKTKEIDGSEYNRMGLILRYMVYYSPGGPGWKKGYNGNKAGNKWSIYNGKTLSECYDIAHVMCCIWRADYKDEGTDIISWNAAVNEISKGNHSYMNTEMFKTGAKFIYDFYKKAFYDAGGDKVDFDKMYENVPKNYVAGYFVCEGDNQDFTTGFNPDIPSSKIGVAKKSSSTKITIDDLEDGTEEELDEKDLHKALQEILDFLNSNELYSLEGTQIKLEGPGVASEKSTKIIKKSNDYEIEWDSEDGELSAAGGKYTMQEVKASKGYKLNKTAKSKTLKPNDDEEIVLYNDPITIPLGVKVNIKGSGVKSESSIRSVKEPQDFTGEFKVEYWDKVNKIDPENADKEYGAPKAAFTIVTNKNGSAIFDNEHITFASDDGAGKKYLERFTQGEGLPLGYYRITEIKAPKGYIPDNTPAAFIFDDSNEYTRVNRPVYYNMFNNARHEWSDPVTLGGCDEMTADGCNEVLYSREVTNVNVPYFIGIEAEKRDNETYKNVPQGDVENFNGIKFEIINNGPAINTMFDVKGNMLPNAGTGERRTIEHGAVAYEGTVGSDGLIKTAGGKDNDGKVLPAACKEDGGTQYILRESESIEGYHKNSEWTIKVTRYQEEYSDKKPGEVIDTKANTDRVTSSFSQGVIEDNVWRGGIEVQKWDHYLNKSEAVNGRGHDATGHQGTDLNDIVFTVINRSKHEVVVPEDIDSSIRGSNAPTDIDHAVKTGMYTDTRLKIVGPGETAGTITTAWDDERKAYTAKTQSNALPYGTYEIRETENNRYYQLTDNAPRIVEIRRDGVLVKKCKDGSDLVFKDKPWRQNIKIKKVMDSTNQPGAYIPFRVTSTSTGECHYFVTDSNGEYDSSDIAKTQNTNGYDSYIKECLEKGKTIESSILKGMRVNEKGNRPIVPGLWFAGGEDGSSQPPDDGLASMPYGKYELEEIECDSNKSKTMIKKHFFIGNEEHKVMFNSEKPIDLGTITNRTAEIRTEAESDASRKHEAPISEQTSITDTVSYTGLTEGKEYTVSGILMKKVNEGGKAAGTPLTDKDNNKITASKTFTAAGGGTGTVKLKFIFDSSLLTGTTTVVFEDLYEDDNLIATHSDIEDKDQTIRFAGIRTTATDKPSGVHQLTISENAVIIDTVSYSALTAGEQYTLEGRLMKVTGEGENMKTEPVRDSNGREIRAEKSFIPKNSEGSENVEFTFDATKMEGGDTVVFEKLSHNGDIIAEHADPEDKGQTVKIPDKPVEPDEPEGPEQTKQPEQPDKPGENDKPGIRTKAKDAVTGKNKVTGNRYSKVTDTVSYSNLQPGTEYTVYGTLYDLTKDKITDIKADTTFTPKKPDGDVKVSFSFDSRDLKGHKLVAFEELKYKEKTVARHKDKKDKKQTVSIVKASHGNKTAKTGDDFELYLAAELFLTAGAAAFVISKLSDDH